MTHGPKISRRAILRAGAAGFGLLATAACAPKVVEKIVKETVVVTEQKEVEKLVKETVVVTEQKEVTRVVEKAVPAPGGVTIRYHARAAAAQAPASEYPTHQNRLAEFLQENPDIKVVFEGIAGTNQEYYVKLATMYVGGTLGDMTFTSQTYSMHLKLANDGVLAPCDDLMAASGIKEDEWWPAAIEGSKLDGKLYGLPMCLHPGGYAFIMYNQNMFQEAGLKEPDSKTYTVDDLRQAANKLAKGDKGARTVYGWLPLFSGIQAHEGWMRSFGAESWIDKEGKKSLINTPEALEWAKLVYAVYNEDDIAPKAEALPTGGTLSMFAAGNLAAFQSGTWDIKNAISLTAGNFKVGYQLFPIGKRYGACGYLNSFAPTSVSKHLPEAWKLTYAFCDQRAGYLQLKLAASLPGRSDVFDIKDIASDAVCMVEKAAMQGIAKQYWMYNFAAIEHEQALNTVITKLQLGEEQPTQAYMDAAYETLQKIIDKPR